MTLTSDVVETIVRVLSPYVGETMARSATAAQCQKLGIDGAQMTPEAAESLIARLGSGLNIFIGRERSARVVDELRRVVAQAGGGK
jgi:hypothetical protein